MQSGAFTQFCVQCQAQAESDPKAVEIARDRALPTFEVSSASAKFADDYDDALDDDEGDDENDNGETKLDDNDDPDDDGGDRETGAERQRITSAADGGADEFVVVADNQEQHVVEVLSWGAGSNGVLGLGAETTLKVTPTLLRFDEMFELM